MHAPYLPWHGETTRETTWNYTTDESRLQQNRSNFVRTTWTSSQVSEMFEKRVILAVTIKVTFAVQTITQEIISFLNVLSSGGVSSRARYDEILKAKERKVIFCTQARDNVILCWYFLLGFCTVVFAFLSNHCARNPVYHCEVQFKCSKGTLWFERLLSWKAFFFFKRGSRLLIGENPRFYENILDLALVLKRSLNHAPRDPSILSSTTKK